MLIIIVGFLDVMFALFTLCMTCDQSRMICEDTSTIDKMQSNRNRLVTSHESAKSNHIVNLNKEDDEEANNKDNLAVNQGNDQA